MDCDYDYVTIRDGVWSLSPFAFGWRSGFLACSTAPETAFFYRQRNTLFQLLDHFFQKGTASAAVFQGLLPAELPSSHPLLWPHGVDAERLLAGSVHGKEVAEDLLSAGGSS